MIEIKNLSLSYDKIDIVKNFNLKINDNDKIALIGESGSGKSSIINAIFNIDENILVKSGDIYFNNEKISSEDFRKKCKKEISIVIQDALNALDPMYKVKEQFVERNNLEKLLEIFNLEKDILEKYPHELSGGMKQRILLIMALIKEPKILILDEPTTAIDRENIDILIKYINSKNISLFVVTHDLEFAFSVTDKSYIIRKGIVVESGKNKDILNNPKNEYTKELMNNIYLSKKSKRDNFEEVVLQVKNLKYKFNEKEINYPDFSLKRNEILGIVGKSGVGKTTLAKLIVGLLKQEQGEIIALEKIILLFQSSISSLNPSLTIRKQINNIIKLTKKNNIDISFYLRQLELDEEILDKYQKELSGGQVKRVAILMTIIYGAKIIIFDEPTAGLDVHLRKNLLSLIEKINNMGITIIIISHDINFIEAVSDNVLNI